SKLINQIYILNNQYDVVCTNPPYMGRKSMNQTLRKYLDKNYPTTKADLFSVFIERGFELTKENGFNTQVTMQSWMFLSTFEKMRINIFKKYTITTLLHMDNNVMGIAFGTAATVFRKNNLKEYKGKYVEVKNDDLKNDNMPVTFPIKENRQGEKTSNEFSKIPGKSIAYWVSKDLIENFDYNLISSELKTREGMAT